VKHDDVEIEKHDQDQASVKQSLISSYKKNLYPALKEDIHQNNTEPLVFPSRGTSRRKRNFRFYFIDVAFPLRNEVIMHSPVVSYISKDSFFRFIK
jgi:hypothetical protein